MFAAARFLLLAALVCFCSGCELNRVLVIKPDGSGRIEERMLAPRDSYVTKQKPGEPLTMGLSQPTAEFVGKKAAEYGEGVEVVSYKKIEDGDLMGYEAIYAFPDVTKLDAGLFLQEESSADPAHVASGSKAPRLFQFTKGPVNELRVPMAPKTKKADDKPSETPLAKEDPKQREAIQEAFKHLNVRIAIHVDGNIESTNSHFRKDNDVVVFEINTKDMAADPKYAEYFKKDGATPMPKEAPPDDRYFKHEELDALSIRFQ